MRERMQVFFRDFTKNCAAADEPDPPRTNDVVVVVLILSSVEVDAPAMTTAQRTSAAAQEATMKTASRVGDSFRANCVTEASGATCLIVGDVQRTAWRTREGTALLGALANAVIIMVVDLPG